MRQFTKCEKFLGAVLLGILLVWSVGVPIWGEFKYRIALINLGHPRRYTQAIRTISRHDPSERRMRDLESRLRHSDHSVRWRTARILKGWSYEPDSPEDEFHYANSLGDFHRIPFQTDRIIEYALDPVHDSGIQFYPLNRLSSWVDPRIREKLLSLQPLEVTDANRLMGESQTEAHARITKLWLRSLALQGSVEDNEVIASYLTYPHPWVQSVAIQALGNSRGYDYLDEIIGVLEGFLSVRDRPVPLQNRFDWSYSGYTAKNLADDRWFPLFNEILATEEPLYRRVSTLAIDFSSAIGTRMDNKQMVENLRTFLNRAPDHLLWSWRFEDFKKRVLENEKPVFPSPTNRPFKRVVLNLADTEEVDESQFEDLDREVQSLIEQMRQRMIRQESISELRGKLRELSRTNHPDLVPLLTCVQVKENDRGYVFRDSYDYLGRMNVQTAYLQMCSTLEHNRASWEGLAALGDPRAIPEVGAWLPEVRYFRWAAGTLQAIGWQPQTDEERSFLLIYNQDPEELALHQEMLGNFLRSQLSSTEVRRRDFAAYTIVGLGLDDLVPDLIQALESSGDGRLACRMYHSGHPLLRANAEAWIEAAPPGLLIRGVVGVREGWGHWISAT